VQDREPVTGTGVRLRQRASDEHDDKG
jgi:hypothetical protein